jgi:hypothetical protein
MPNCCDCRSAGVAAGMFVLHFATLIAVVLSGVVYVGHHGTHVLHANWNAPFPVCCCSSHRSLAVVDGVNECSLDGFMFDGF